eukprot:CAMPEP_0206237788 /NCGR_PEP_ID=MMETSP0047_2-20121206/14453_1 /ASSEMBLY_ACC=CAM_ASM_000192 /TAXON_ID=195065 /ORGANISM="Chroomonas mesostigmatica_cf, Strain CCMP1168" /LENGTH=397 /DNA_ID=CAMNT_0053662249 /DNA_START=102 /DNA_END=1295 /DNA_ORIENTATION=+
MTGSRMFATAASKTALKGPRAPLVQAKRVLVKVGSAVVSKDSGKMALCRMGGLVEQIAELRKKGIEVMLVSSGAVGIGRYCTNLPKEVVRDPKNVIDRQACAAAGQEMLMSTYDMMFQRVGLKCAQVLITQGDFLSQDRYFALSSTLERLANLGLVPVINENDVVTGSHFGNAPRVFEDNDMLSAIVASGCDADALALMTDVDGVYNMPPDQPGAQRISVYEQGTEIEIGLKSGMGRGGMSSKIAAASLAAAGGVQTVVASGYDVNNIGRVFAGEDIGTLFPALERPTKSQRWLSFFVNTVGSVKVNQDAMVRLLGSPNQSHLTLRDVMEVNGHFDASEPVRLLDHTGKEFARGVTHMGAEQINKSLTMGPECSYGLDPMDMLSNPLLRPGELFVVH